MSNGSEHIPEATDYKTLIDEARRGTSGYSEGDLRSLAKALADAVESLLAIEQRLTDHIVQLAAERDALQERLDAMQVEWSAPDTASIETVPFPFGYGTDQEMARRSAAELHGPVYRRLVSEWTVVEGEQPHA